MKKDFENIPANPDLPTVQLDSYQRALGRLVGLDATCVPGKENQSVQDLMGDAFWSYYSTVEAKTEIPPERIINRKLLDWAQKSPAWAKGQYDTWGSLLGSTYASQILTTQLLSDPRIMEAINKAEEARKEREEAEQAQKEAEQAQKEAKAAANAGNNAKANQKQKEANEARSKADAKNKSAQDKQGQAEAEIDKLTGSADGQAVRAQAVVNAGKAGEKANNELRGWGIGPGDVTPANVKDIAAVMNKNSQLSQIAALAGRAKGIAMTRFGKAKNGVVVTEVNLTKDATRIFPTELAWLGNNAPAILRAQKVAAFIDYGLLGLVSHTEAKHEGRLVVAVDDSGSMSGHAAGYTRTVIARALALGISEAARDNGQKFTVFSFADNGTFPSITDKSEKLDVINWVGSHDGGGTNFDSALDNAIDEVESGEDADDADIIFISDGDCSVNKETVQKYFDLKERRGTRLILLQIGGSGYGDIDKISTTVCKVDDDDTLETLAERLTASLEREESK